MDEEIVELNRRYREGRISLEEYHLRKEEVLNRKESKIRKRKKLKALKYAVIWLFVWFLIWFVFKFL